MKEKWFGRILMVVALSGALYSHHLTTLVNAGSQADLACSAKSAFDCAKNLTSDYGKISGIPVSVFATAFFVFLFISTVLSSSGIARPNFHAARAFNEEDARRERFAVPLALSYLAGLICLYFLLISIFVLHSICLYCSIMYGLIALTLAVSYLGLHVPLTRQPAFVRSALKNWLTSPLNQKLNRSITFTAAMIVAAGAAWISAAMPFVRSASDSAIAVARSGDSAEPIAVTEFIDFECPACKRAGLELEKLQAAHPGKLEIHFVNFPLCHECNAGVPRNMHAHACLAAKIGIVMKQRGKFEDYSHRVFADTAVTDERRLYEIVADLGEQVQDVRRQVESAETAAALRNDVDFGHRQGVLTTPTLVIDGKVAQGAGVLPRLKTALETQSQFANVELPVAYPGTSMHGLDTALKGWSAGILASSGPIVINGQNGTVIQNLKITSTTGDCVQIVNSTNITLQNVEIGPCGGNGVNISGGNGIDIFDSYIHPETQSPGCCDNNDGIFAHDVPKNITIQGNVIAYGESNIEITGGVTVNVTGNFLLNPRGPFPRGQNFQCWGDSTNPCSSVTVQNNYALSSLDTGKYLFAENQEDSINFGFTNGAVAQNNFISGGHSSSGCGLIADSTANDAQFKNNLLLNTGQCGIGIASGTNQVVDGNKVYNTNPVTGGGNTAIYVWNQYSSGCGPTTVSNNIADEIRSDGSHSGFWDGGGCSATLTNNVFDQSADAQLTPVATVFAPPMIPPQPRNCVVVSPYSTQTGLPSCAAGTASPVISTQPVNQTVTAGATATFSVAATGSGPLTYQWRKNGANISGATGASYTTPATTSANSGATFAVVVSNSAGSVTSANAILTVNSSASGIPRPAHLVIVIEENHAYSEIIGSSSAPYINSLANSAALFTNSFAIEHPSQPNYLDLFSGSNQGVTDDNVPSGVPFTTPNLGAELLAKNYSFTTFSESLPAVGYSGPDTGNYARKHNPEVNWQGASANEIPVSSNQPFTSFPSDFSTLPTVTIVIPNLQDDMHDGTISQGDQWLKNHMDSYAQWAKTNNSLLIVTWDEDDDSGSNQIPTFFVGPMVKTSHYGELINHFSVLRTIEDMYGLPHAGASATATPITDIWASSNAPVITSQPANQTVTAGQTATFSVSASGVNLSYQWQQNGSNISGATSASYTTAATKIGDNGAAFDVIVSNSAGSVTSNVATLTVTTPTESPYGGTPWPIPGQIEAENYDLGGEAVAYHDTTPGNTGGAYRNDDVDIRACVDTGGGYQVGWTAEGEWLKFSVNVAATGNYVFTGRIADGGNPGALHVEFDGSNVTGSMTVPNTGSWDTWQNLSTTINLTAGQHIMRVYVESGGFDMNWFAFKSANTPPTLKSAASATPAAVQTGQTVTFTVAATDNDGDSVSYAWNFGDGAAATGATVTHAYSAAGTYTAVATISDGNGNAITSSVSVTVNTAAPPTLQINSGGKAAGSFVADNSFSGGHTYSTTHAISRTGVVNPAPSAVYQSERYGNFTYTLANLSAGATYTVRLHFAEIYWSSSGRRIFNVSINGAQVLSNFDIYAVAGGKYKAIVKEFTATATNGQITIVYSTVKDNAKSSGIELIPVAGTASRDVAEADDVVLSSIDLGSYKANSNFTIALEMPDSGAVARKLRWAGARGAKLPAGAHLAGTAISGKIKKPGTYTFQLQMKAPDKGTVANTYTITITE